MSASMLKNLRLAELIDDRPEAGVFTLHRDIYTHRELFELELARVFEGTWIFLGLASEVAKPHDYITRQIGRKPVLLTRDKDGALRCFHNSCRHRGTLLCPFAHGNQKFHTCRYHGWVYDSGGRNCAITAHAEGQYPAAFEQEDHNLTAIAKLDTYREFIFGSLSPNVPSLREHLGDAATLLDLVADQAPNGLEFIPGSITYTFEGNWKLQFENGVDAYHFPATHAAFVDILRKRGPRAQTLKTSIELQEIGEVAAGTMNFPRGHCASWSIGVPGQDPISRPLVHDPQNFKKVREAVSADRLDWMLRQRNLTIFPNMQLIDIQSLQLRSWHPLAVDKTRMTSRCLAPVGESAEARRFRIRQYEEFFNASGLATSDDNVMYELNQEGLAAAGFQSQGHSRGLGAPRADPAFFAGLDFKHAEVTYSKAGLPFGDESAIRNGYREWRRLMLNDDV